MAPVPVFRKDMSHSLLNLEFGLQSDLFWNPLGPDEVKAACSRGFSFFEIWGHKPWFDIYSDPAATETCAVVEDAGMRIRSVHAPCEGDWDISSNDNDIRKKSTNEVILSIEKCRTMGGEVTVVHPGRALTSHGQAAITEHEVRINNTIRGFQDIQKAAADNAIRIAIENPWPEDVGGKEEYFLRLLRAVDPTICGLCFDSSHANMTSGVLEMFERLNFQIITTHLSDNHGQYDEHSPPFTASVDWPRVVAMILKNGFFGPWLLEISNGGNDPIEVLDLIQRSTEKLKSLLVRTAEKF